MPPFQTKRQEQILADEIASVVTNTALSDVADSSSVKHVLNATAREIDEAYFQMENLQSLFSIDATGEDLDERAKDVQPATITRIGPRSAVGTVTFSRSTTTGTINIPAGTRVKTSGDVIFVTSALATITGASVEQISGHGVGRDAAPVAISAQIPGTPGNVVANTIIRFDTKPTGVDEVTNQQATTLGRDQEKDDAFRQRIKDFIASLARCTVQAIENGVLGIEDPNTGASIIFSKVIEDQVDLGNVTLFVDDGTGAVETVAVLAATALAATYTWNTTTTVTTPNTSGVVAGDFIRLDADGQWFEISAITPNVDVTILNPGALTIPAGATASSVATGAERVTLGLAGPPADSAVGGEETLFLDNIAIKPTVAFSLVSSSRGILVEDTEFTLNNASGQLNFTPALAAAEVLFAEYTRFTGLLELAQRTVDGDPTDRTNFPGLRAAGVFVQALTPTVLIQTVTASLVVADGFNRPDAVAAAENAIVTYVNSLNISDDVIKQEISSQIQRLPEVADHTLTAPATNIVILDDQLARTTSANITVI